MTVAKYVCVCARVRVRAGVCVCVCVRERVRVCIHMLQVLSNLYGAHMDPNVWNEPDSFKPDRFLDKDGQVMHKEKVIAFSLGMSTPDIHFESRISFTAVLRFMLHA
jgi:hypothetical protein